MTDYIEEARKLAQEYADFWLEDEAEKMIAAALAAAEERGRPQWQPIETAPKDGKHSIFAVKCGPFVYSIQGMWDGHQKKWINAGDREGEYLAWMPNTLLPDEFCPWTDEYKVRAAITKEPTP